MNPADETAGKIEATERQLAGAVAGSDDKVDELSVARHRSGRTNTTSTQVSTPTSMDVSPDFSNCLQRFFKLRLFR
jgi:hypothetical protein